MAKLSEIQTIEFAAEPNTDLTVVLESIGSQFETFKTENPDAEFLSTFFIGPVKENDVWGASGILIYKTAVNP